MKYLVLTLILVFTGFLNAEAQTKSSQQKKIEKKFLKQLNVIINNGHPQHHWSTESRYTVAQPFAIDDSGVISVTLRYTNDTSWYLHRMQMPMSALKGIVWDIYAIMDVIDSENAVTVLESEPGQTKLKEVERRYLFHIAAVEDEKIITDLQKTCSKLLPFYEKKP